jgi:hypothetical protein
MKIASKKPANVKSPVRVTDTRYAMYYARSVFLGHINRDGNYWYTEDGMRFASSRNALDYLITLRDLLEKELQVDEKFTERMASKATTPPVRKGAASAKRKEDLNAQLHVILSKLGYSRSETLDK